MTATRRYRLDDDAERHGRVLVGGSPLRLFRLTEAGADVVDRLVAGDAVDDSRLVRSLLDAGAIHPTVDTPIRFGIDDVTVVVPTFGPPAHAPADALVVDDGSPVPVPCARVRLPTNRGPAAARNVGLAHVTTPLVAFVDGDVELPDGWLDPLLAHFDDDDVALVAPRVTSAAASTLLGAYEAGHSPLDLGDRPARVRVGSRVGYVPAAAIVARVDALRGIGGFDEELRYGEDVDLAWRLAEAGWRLRYEPTAVVLHDPRTTWRDWLVQRASYGSSAAPLARRHPGALAPVRLSGWSAAAWLLGLGVHPVAGLSVAAGSATALVRKLRDLPPRVAFGLAWRGNLHAGTQLAVAVRRTWWPLLLPAAVVSRRVRLALVLAGLAAQHPIRLADDVAYSVGVWRGIVAERTIAPLVPEISSWPGRRPPTASPR